MTFEAQIYLLNFSVYIFPCRKQLLIEPEFGVSFDLQKSGCEDIACRYHSFVFFFFLIFFVILIFQGKPFCFASYHSFVQMNFFSRFLERKKLINLLN